MLLVHKPEGLYALYKNKNIQRATVLQLQKIHYNLKTTQYNYVINKCDLTWDLKMLKESAWRI